MRTINRKDLTASAIRGLKPTTKSCYRVWDLHARGLCVIVQRSGTKTFYYSYSMRGRTRWYRIGPADVIKIDEARRIARTLAEQVNTGRDPASEPGGPQVDSVAKKFSKFLDKDIEPACYLYRHYDPSGDLLYVGISVDGLRRQLKHFKLSTWRTAICLIVIEPFATRRRAEEAERVAITTECPRYNSIYNGHRQLRIADRVTMALGRARKVREARR